MTIQTVLNGMITLLLAKFIVIELPHAAGLFGSNHMMSLPSTDNSKYYLTRDGWEAASLLWLVNSAFYRSISSIAEVPVELPESKVINLLTVGDPDLRTREDLQILQEAGSVGYTTFKLMLQARDPSTASQTIAKVKRGLDRLVKEGILEKAWGNVFLINRRYLIIYEIVERFVALAQSVGEARTLKDMFEETEMGYWAMEDYIEPLNVTFDMYCSYVELLIRQGYIAKVG